MRNSLRRILAGVGGSALALAASVGHAAYITGQQYSFSGTAGTFTVSGSFTIGAETGVGTGIFKFSSFTADSGAPGTDSISGIDDLDTVTSNGLFTVSFALSDGYSLVLALPGSTSTNLPDNVFLSGAGIMEYEANALITTQAPCVRNPDGTLGPCDPPRTLFATSTESGTFSVQLTDGGNRVPEPGILALAGFAATAGALVGRSRRRA